MINFTIEVTEDFTGIDFCEWKLSPCKRLVSDNESGVVVLSKGTFLTIYWLVREK